MHANAQNNVTKYYCYSSIVPCRLPDLFNDYYSYNKIMYSACNVENIFISMQGRTMVHKHSIKVQVYVCIILMQVVCAEAFMIIVFRVQKHITLSNEGYGFGFLISPAKESGTVVESLIPNGVAWKVSVLYIQCSKQRQPNVLEGAKNEIPYFCLLILIEA